jgi:hypothetical protein
MKAIMDINIEKNCTVVNPVFLIFPFVFSPLPNPSGNARLGRVCTAVGANLAKFRVLWGFGNG